MDNLNHDLSNLFTEEETKAMQTAMDEVSAMPLDFEGLSPDGDPSLDLHDLDLQSIPVTPAPTGSPVALPAPPTGPTKLISIRIPHDVMDAIKREANRNGTRPQTLVNQMLRTLSATW